ncbi:MAG: hypothetical protein A2020_13920 [Lentisphaerae bacterium GWF2_45_14]|nr:MAG: hypothetical protein A2020_13920 [Lentisphaerae bacterium GWF2_45_14]
MERRKRRPQSFYDIEIDLHGKNTEEAVAIIEETVFANGPATILIIHGRGDGILKREIRKYLHESKYVKNVLFGEENNIPGADGVTVVYT